MGKLYPRIRLAFVRARKLARLAGTPAYWPALRKGVAASVEHAKIPLGPEFATIIDVGASRGQFALFALQRFPAAAITCFEPQPGPARDLHRLLGERVDLIKTALGPQAGRATMNISAQDDSSSLLKIGARQASEFPGTESDHTIEVDVTTLDDSIDRPIERPCLLKVDVQGFELDVLRGGINVLREVDVALVECSFVELYENQSLADEVIPFMLELGFHLAGVHDIGYSEDGSAIQGDFLFRRPREDR